MEAPDAGVTAPLGILLIVIISVMLAAGLFMFGKILVDRSEEQELVAVKHMQEQSALQVIQVDEKLDWYADIKLQGTCTPTLNGGAMPMAAGRTVQAGDVLDCDPGETLTLISRVDNIVIMRAEF